jgi:putative CocE/NonD family hydrolase
VAQGGPPILLTRTPYGADERITQQPSKYLSAVLGNKDVVDELVLNEGYIRVLQDVRGTHRSEGDYIMTRPLQGPLNPTNVDHSTDTYDTIDWLVKNIPESNGKVGILGISYDGFTALMALFHPHPALRAAMPINPMVDGWMGDDWSHNGAFRQLSLVYWYGQEATRDHKEKWWSDHFDDLCDWRLKHLIEAHDWIGQRSINPPMDEIVWTPTKIRDFPRHAIPNRLVRFETNPLHRRHVCPPIPTRIHYYAFQDV